MNNSVSVTCVHIFNVCSGLFSFAHISLCNDRVEKIANFIKVQKKERGDFEAERDKLFQEHEEKMAAMRKRHWEEEFKLEKEFDAELERLMEKYTPHSSKDATDKL